MSQHFIRRNFIQQLFLVLLLAAVVPLMTGCETIKSLGLLEGLKKPEIRSITPRITGLNFKAIDMAFDVDVHNPYSVALKTPKFKYGLDLADQSFLESDALAEADLPANDTGTITLPVQLGYKDIWKGFQQFKDASEVPYTLKGALVVTPFGKDIELPMQKKGVFPILKPPKFSDYQFAKPDISLGKAKVALDMAVQNPNVFGMNLENLGYALKLGEIEVGNLKATPLGELKAGESQRVKLTGSISGIDAVKQILSGDALGMVQLTPVGSITTPYGKVKPPGAK